MNGLRCKTNIQITVEEDFNVPDAKPDIEKMIKEQGEIQLSQMKVTPGRAELAGTLNYCCLYFSDSKGTKVSSMKGQVPIRETVQLDGLQESDNLQVKWVIDNLSIVILNSRKISVRALVSFYLVGEYMQDLEMITQVPEDAGMELLYETMTLTNLKVQKREVLSIRERMTLPAGKGNVGETLFSELTFNNVDYRIGEGKIIMKGDLHLFFLYRGENPEQPIEYIEGDFPYNQQIDCSGAAEGMVPDITRQIREQSVEVEADEDGEYRIIQCNMLCELDCKLYQEEETEVLKDAYSVSQEVMPVSQKAVYETLVIRNYLRSKVIERIELENGSESVMQVCSASGGLLIDEEKMTDQGIQINGVLEVSVLFIQNDDENPLGSASFTMPFERTMEVEGLDKNCIFKIKPYLEQLTVIMLDGKEAEVRGSIAFDAIVFRRHEKEMLTDLNLLPKDMEKWEKRPVLAGYVAEEGDSLWTIGKEWQVSREELMELNELTEEIKAGDKLLIMKETPELA